MICSLVPSVVIPKSWLFRNLLIAMSDFESVVSDWKKGMQCYTIHAHLGKSSMADVARGAQ